MSAKHRVLVAEDDRSIRDLIRAHLQIAGYEVHVARDGGEAIQMVASARPEALVLDINMPAVDGFGVLRALHDSGVRLPVLMLTARHAQADVKRSIELGARDFLAKPFTEGQLLSRVARLFVTRPAARQGAA